ncbi:MAG: peptidylprolyl isomerase [Burkholderiaceae bacterium]|jgi:peptidyl-prolyl cis-trans isomerase SurA|nr:peptidylprolyl isomerase [Burkholderiaceae bacterium]
MRPFTPPPPYRILCPALFSALFFVCLHADAQPRSESRRAPPRMVDSIVVVVNNDVITKRELDDRINVVKGNLRRRNINLPPQKELEAQVLNHMILENIQIQMAKDRGIRVDDQHLDRTVAAIAEQNRTPLDAFIRQLEKEGVALASFREKIRNDIMIQRLREREVLNKVEISDSEIDHVLGTDATFKTSALPIEIRLAHILIRIPENASPEQIAQRRQRAETVLQTVRAGKDFQQSATVYSDSDDGLNGGDMGWRSMDRLPSLFAEAVANLKRGDVSAIVKSANGFHILKVLDRKDASPQALPSGAPTLGPVQQIHARHILIKVNQLVSADEARHRLMELKERLSHKAASFEELARRFSNDASASKGGDLGWVYPGDTVPEFERALLSLKPGEVSNPVETPFGFHLIQVLERKTEDASTERKRVAVKNALREHKIAEATEDWLRQIRDRAYVEYRTEDR